LLEALKNYPLSKISAYFHKSYTCNYIHRELLVGRPLRCMYRWILIVLLPFRNPITKAILYFGGTLMHIWTWLGFRLPYTISIPRCRAKSLSISPTCLLNLPYSFLFRYLGTITMWYLQSQRTCDKLCQSCIGSFSFCPYGTFPRKSLFYFSPDR